MNNRKYLSRLFLPIVLLVAVMLSSCTNYSNTRLLKKFVSRFNAEEYACASTYIYSEDRMQLAFFANEVRPQCPSCFVKVLDTRCENDYMVVELKWINANDFLRNYFANIGIPLTADDVLHDTITIRETTEGTMLSFEWGILDHNTSNLRLASIFDCCSMKI